MFMRLKGHNRLSYTENIPTASLRKSASFPKILKFTKIIIVCHLCRHLSDVVELYSSVQASKKGNFGNFGNFQH